MKKIIVTVIMTILALSNIKADTNQSSWMLTLVNDTLSYTTSNHNMVATGGPGGAVSDLKNCKFSAVVAESLCIWDNANTNYNWKLDVANTTTICDDKTHQGLGLDIRYIGGLPNSFKLHIPVLGKIGTFHSLIGIAPDVDSSIKGRFDARNTVIWTGFGLGGD